MEAVDEEICKEDEVGWDETTVVDVVEEELGPPFCRVCDSLSPAIDAVWVDVVRVRMDTVKVTATEIFLDVDWFMSGCWSVSSADSHWPVSSSAASAVLSGESSRPALAADVFLPASLFAVEPLSRSDDPPDVRTLRSDGLVTIRLRYHSRLSSNRSSIS